MHVFVRLRILLARHPSLYWTAAILVTIQVATALDQRLDRLDEARRAWTQTRTVWVAVADHRPGDPVRAEQRALPEAAVPDAALAETPRGTVVQRVAAGEVLTGADLGDDRFALLPDGWEGVAVGTGAPSLPLEPGDHVRIVGPSGVLVDDAIVMSVADGAAVVAAPSTQAATLALAAQEQSVALALRRP